MSSVVMPAEMAPALDQTAGSQAAKAELSMSIAESVAATQCSFAPSTLPVCQPLESSHAASMPTDHVPLSTVDAASAVTADQHQPVDMSNTVRPASAAGIDVSYQLPGDDDGQKDSAIASLQVPATTSQLPESAAAIQHLVLQAAATAPAPTSAAAEAKVPVYVLQPFPVSQTLQHYAQPGVNSVPVQQAPVGAFVNDVFRHDQGKQQHQQHVVPHIMPAPEKLLTKLIKGSKAVSELTQLVLQYGDQMNCIHISAAFSRIPKMTQLCTSHASVQMLLHHLATLLQAQIHDCNSWSLAASVWACGKLQYHNKTFLLTCLKQFTAIINHAMPMDIANVLWALATLDYQATLEQIQQLVDSITNPQQLAQAIPANLCNTLWAMAKFGYVGRPGQVQALLDTLCQPVMLQYAQPHDVSNALWSLTALNCTGLVDQFKAALNAVGQPAMLHTQLAAKLYVAPPNSRPAFSLANPQAAVRATSSPGPTLSGQVLLTPLPSVSEGDTAERQLPAAQQSGMLAVTGGGNGMQQSAYPSMSTAMSVQAGGGADAQQYVVAPLTGANGAPLSAPENETPFAHFATATLVAQDGLSNPAGASTMHNHATATAGFQTNPSQQLQSYYVMEPSQQAMQLTASDMASDQTNMMSLSSGSHVGSEHTNVSMSISGGSHVGELSTEHASMSVTSEQVELAPHTSALPVVVLSTAPMSSGLHSLPYARSSPTLQQLQQQQQFVAAGATLQGQPDLSDMQQQASPSMLLQHQQQQGKPSQLLPLQAYGNSAMMSMSSGALTAANTVQMQYMPHSAQAVGATHPQIVKHPSGGMPANNGQGFRYGTKSYQQQQQQQQQQLTSMSHQPGRQLYAPSGSMMTSQYNTNTMMAGPAAPPGIYNAPQYATAANVAAVAPQATGPAGGMSFVGGFQSSDVNAMLLQSQQQQQQMQQWGQQPLVQMQQMQQPGLQQPPVYMSAVYPNQGLQAVPMSHASTQDSMVGMDLPYGSSMMSGNRPAYGTYVSSSNCRQQIMLLQGDGNQQQQQQQYVVMQPGNMYEQQQQQQHVMVSADSATSGQHTSHAGSYMIATPDYLQQQQPQQQFFTS
eukprot:jgi/Chrzof1/8112/UNPLg00157.t1